MNEPRNSIHHNAVQVHEFGGGSKSGTPFSNHLRVLTQPLKLKLVRRAGQESKLRENKNAVLIEPLATIRAVEEFLWPVVKIDPSDPSGRSVCVWLCVRVWVGGWVGFAGKHHVAYGPPMLISCRLGVSFVTVFG